jgi:membrane protease YdiL (CAAX protease family)
VTAHAIAIPAEHVPSNRTELGRVLAGCALMFVILQGGATLLLTRFDLPSASLVVTVVMLAIALAIEAVVYRRDLARGLRALGFGRPNPRAILASVVIGGAMLAFFPIYALATGKPLALKSDWLWILAGAIALNGIAEETLFRGYVFGHLRQGGRSFRRAGAISLAIFAAVHLFLFATSPIVVAVFATVLAVLAAFPFAFLYERGANTIWAGVILHVVAHSFRLLDLSEAQLITVSSLWALVQLGAMGLVFAFGTTLLRRPEARRPATAA